MADIISYLNEEAIIVMLILDVGRLMLKIVK